MKAINRANELIEMFTMDNTSEGYSRGVKCAIICVDEIIDQINNLLFLNYEKRIEYWNEVRNEIKECES